MKFRYLREGILNKMGKVAGGMAAAGGALQAGKMVHNAIKPKEVSEYDDYDCDEGVIGKTVKYGFAAGAALGAGKMARDAIKNRKTVSEYDDYDCDEGVGTALMKVGGKSSVLKRAGDAIRSGASKLKSKAGAMKNSLKTDYVSKGSALKVAAGTAAAGAAGGTVAGSKLAGKRNESLAAAMNGGRIPRRAKSVSVQESVNALQRYGIATKISREDADVLFQSYKSAVTYRDKMEALSNIGFECRDDIDEPIAEVFIDKDYSIFLDAANQKGLVKASLIMPDGETAEYEVCDDAKSLEDFLKLCVKIVDRYV